jgi:Uma2 family endonuclease
MTVEALNLPRVVLRDISWQTYTSMLRDLGDHRNARLAYNQGVLEITMPSDRHEALKHLLERVVIALTEELDLPLRGAGSTTFNRSDLRRGAEPDASYYIQNARRVHSKTIDLQLDPPPDLVIEIDLSHPSAIKMPIYAALAVPEIWIASEDSLAIYVLQEEQYVKLSQGLAFPKVTAEQLGNWLRQLDTDDAHTIIRDLREWIRRHR